jgi:hypothetical protein
MRKLMTAAAMAAFGLAATPAFASGPMATNGMTYSEVAKSYGDTYGKAGRGTEATDERVARQMANLDALCSSHHWSDVRRCNQTWRVINRQYARLQARKAAQSAD